MSLDVYTYQLNGFDSTNKYISLDGTPVSSGTVAMDIISGTAQSYNRDFRVDGTKVAWDSTDFALYNLLVEKSIVRIMYDRS